MIAPVATRCTAVVRGDFDLRATVEYFGPWERSPGGAVVAAFPVEGWPGSAEVAISQGTGGALTGEVRSARSLAESAWRQLLEALSVDVDGSGFGAVGARDPVIGRLQARYGLLRPVSFYSPYEAAVALILGQRSSIAQQRRTRAAMSAQHGATFSVDGVEVSALPEPSELLEIERFPGVSAEKMSRLHGAAQAALDGVLDRTHLRSIPYAQALDEVRAVRGVGEWTAQGIVLRGANLADEVSDDVVSKRAVQLAYELPSLPDHAQVLQMADAWRPYRMWSLVLLHVWLRREMADRMPRRR